MNSFLQKHHRLVFYASWIILTLIQSAFTELLDDEAYYWVYSKFLDWGYFDHPPMVAILIRIGYGIFQNELGVRLLFVLINALSLLIIEKLIDDRNPTLFYSITLSLAVLQISGFLAVPDTPLIFFTALFFLCYRRFLQEVSFLNTFFLGVATAALLYSKYHAVLIVFFVLLSNFKLLRRYQTYLAGLIALLFFAPHLWWQYQHDWISFRYHLFESNVNPYKFAYTLEYLGGQLLLAGPLAGIILLPAALLYHPKNAFEKGLKSTLVGIYIFFLLSSFRGKVEANWTSPAIIPLIILSHNFLLAKNTGIARTGRKWLFRLLPITMILVLLARIALVVDVLPSKEVKKHYHAWRQWPRVMKEKTNGLPVVFGNSYQRASKYWFYSGQTTYSLNWYRERRNNYNFWPIEDSLLGRHVYLLDIHNLDSFQTKMSVGIGLLGYRYDSSWNSFAKVKFKPREKNIHTKENTLLKMTLIPEVSPLYHDYIATHGGLQTEIIAGIFGKNGWIKDIYLPYNLSDWIQQPHEVSFNPELPRGKYYMIISIYSAGTITPTHNSEKIKLVID
jgi:Dolichyl-phosphate-mannose-protein mannosyltransferase